MNPKKTRVKNKYMTIQHQRKPKITVDNESKNHPMIVSPGPNSMIISPGPNSMIVSPGPNSMTVNTCSSNPVIINTKCENIINKYIRNLIRSESDLINSNLKQSMSLLTKGAYYYPHCVCDERDQNLFKRIVSELEDADELKIVSWSQHYKIDNPGCSETFNLIIKKVADMFNAIVCETRLNYYKDQSDWKPMHHDSHAYGESLHLKEDFTIGISLGSTRELVFMHEQSGNIFKFPQKNGDVFAFDHHVNKDFLHGVTKSIIPTGSRISLVAWCKLQNN